MTSADEPRPPPPPPQPAAPGAYQPAVSGSQTNGMAVASLVCALAGLFCGVGFILGLVFGYIGKGQIDQSGGLQQGRGLAVAGIIIGWVGVGLGVLGLVVLIISSAVSGS